MLLLVYRTLRRECSKSHRSLCLDDASAFQHSQWQVGAGRRWWYMGYRWLLCIYLVYGLFYDWVLDELDASKCKGGRLGCRLKWFVYCTNWSYSVVTAQALMAAYLATVQPSTPGESKTTTFQKVYWVLNNISNGLSPAVSLVYWALVYNPEVSIDFGNVKGHVVNVAVGALDLALVSHPVRLLHVAQPLCVGLAFLCFSWLFFMAGGTNRQLQVAIYPAYDWRTPGVALALGTVCELGILLLYTGVWLLYLLRRTLHRTLRRPPDDAQLC